MKNRGEVLNTFQALNRREKPKFSRSGPGCQQAEVGLSSCGTVQNLARVLYEFQPGEVAVLGGVFAGIRQKLF